MLQLFFGLIEVHQSPMNIKLRSAISQRDALLDECAKAERALMDKLADAAGSTLDGAKVSGITMACFLLRSRENECAVAGQEIKTLEDDHAPWQEVARRATSMFRTCQRMQIADPTLVFSYEWFLENLVSTLRMLNVSKTLTSVKHSTQARGLAIHMAGKLMKLSSQPKASAEDESESLTDTALEEGEPQTKQEEFHVSAN